MDALITSLVTTILAGGQSGMLGLCGLFAFVMWSDKNRAMAANSKLHDKLDAIAENYNKGQISIFEALAAIKMSIFEMRR